MADKEFWTKLLTAARDGDKKALADIHLHAELLLSGELIARTTAATLGEVGSPGEEQ